MLKLSENKARELEPSISDKPEVDPLSESDAWSDYLILSGKSIGRSISSTPTASSLTGCALALSSDEFLLKYSDVAKSVSSAAGKMSPEEFALAYKEGTIVAVDPTNDDDCKAISEVLQVPRSWSQPASEMRGRPVDNRWKRRVAAVATGVEEAHVEYLAGIREWASRAGRPAHSQVGEVQQVHLPGRDRLQREISSETSRSRSARSTFEFQACIFIFGILMINVAIKRVCGGLHPPHCMMRRPRHAYFRQVPHGAVTSSCSTGTLSTSRANRRR